MEEAKKKLQAKIQGVEDLVHERKRKLFQSVRERAEAEQRLGRRDKRPKIHQNNVKESSASKIVSFPRFCFLRNCN